MEGCVIGLIPVLAPSAEKRRILTHIESDLDASILLLNNLVLRGAAVWLRHRVSVHNG